ncbi:GNAT family N-acetyltransferase [Saccharopolyspora taberi]|uniref:GNAT family N-acetyltransferase n=1 Tax=Saccharopolyspora taberi TaxID=60895 RepID=UPI0031E0355F
MSRAQELLDAQSSRLKALDPQLPDRYLLPSGEPVMARIPGGEAVAGLMAHARNEPGSQQSLWQAADTFELFPVIGDHPRAGMDALLHAWRAALTQRGTPSTDSSCVVVWPSRDVQATRALLDHGFVPLSVLAVRPPSPGSAPPNTKRSGTVKIRRAGPADLDAIVELTLAELDYAALVGASTRRPNARRLKRTATGVRLHAGDPVWLAELDGQPVAVAECGWFDTDRHQGGHRLRPGKWAYVNCVSVREEARGTGIGGELMALAHDEFARAGVLGSFLYYNPPNPLSSVFWPRQGYRPLWTMWEVRPATALH